MSRKSYYAEMRPVAFGYALAMTNLGRWDGDPDWFADWFAGRPVRMGIRRAWLAWQQMTPRQQREHGKAYAQAG